MWNRFKPFLYTFLSYCGILLYFHFSKEVNYSFFLFLVVIFLFTFFFKRKEITYTKTERNYSFFLSVVTSFILVLGHATYLEIENGSATFLTIPKVLLMFGNILSFLPFFFHLFLILFTYLPKINIYEKEKKEIPKHFYLFTILFLILCYLPYYICYFPGKMTYDTGVQISFIKNGILSNIHPFLHTEFMGIFIHLFGETMGLGIFTFFQICFLSFTYAYLAHYLLEKKVKQKWVYLLILCFGVLPIFTHYAITIWKDIFFAMGFIYLTIGLLKIKEENKGWISFYFGVFLLLFFRNNGIYIFLFFLPFCLFDFRKNLKTCLLFLCPLCVYFMIEGPVYEILHVEKVHSTEVFSIPFQMLARSYDSLSLTESEKNYLDRLTDGTNLKSVYVPSISDPVKGKIKEEVLEESYLSFLSLWLKEGVLHINTYLEAYLSSTLGYWYPGVEYWSTINPERENSNIFQKIIDSTASHRIPFAGVIWNIGLYFYLTFLSFVLSKFLKKKTGIYYTIFFALWLSMMLGSPVFSEFRYIYGVVVSFPIILYLPFLKTKK